MAEIQSTSAGSTRFQAVLLSTFSTVAVFFAAVGLFGVLAYSVSQRLREIGIRAAIGATPLNVLAMVLRKGIAVTAVGLALGIVISYIAMPLISGILYNVDPRDPYLLATVSSSFIAVAVLASLAPALRAARVDPNTVLRSE